MALSAGVTSMLVQPEDPETDDISDTYCALCNCTVPPCGWRSHESGARHRRIQAFRGAFAEGEKNKNGVSVSHVDGGLDFGIVEPGDAEKGLALYLKIHLGDSSADILFLEAKLSSRSDTSP